MAKKVPAKKKAAAKKKNPNDLFTFINSFWDEKKFNAYTDYHLGKFYFMINKFMSITWPLNAAFMGQSGIYPANAVRYWRKMLTLQYHSPPKWLYNTGVKVINKPSYVPTAETITTFCEWNECEPKDIEEMRKLFSDELDEELKAIETRGKVTKR